MSKEQRNKLREEKANTFNEAYKLAHDIAWRLGYEQGQKDKEKEMNK